METRSYRNGNYRYSSRPGNAARINNVKDIHPNKVKSTNIPNEMLSDMVNTLSVANYNQGYVKGYLKGVAGVCAAVAFAGVCGIFVGKFLEKNSNKEPKFDESNFREVKEEEPNGDKEL